MKIREMLTRFFVYIKTILKNTLFLYIYKFDNKTKSSGMYYEIIKSDPKIGAWVQVSSNVAISLKNLKKMKRQPWYLEMLRFYANLETLFPEEWVPEKELSEEDLQKSLQYAVLVPAAEKHVYLKQKLQ